MTATYNARPGQPAGTVARVRFVRMSATKARAVLDLIRGAEVAAAGETLRFCERDAALVVGKLLRSAIANAEHNDDQIAEDLVVSACWADEGRTVRRFRPRARGRATRIRKRTCHITIVVSRMTEEQLERRRNRRDARPGARVARRAGQEAAEERTSGRSRRRRTKGRGEAATPAPTTTTPDAAPSPATTSAVDPEQGDPSPQPEAEQRPDIDQPEADQPEAEQGRQLEAGEDVRNQGPELEPESEAADDDGLGLFDAPEETEPEVTQDAQPPSETPPKADNDPGAPRQTPEGTGGAKHGS
jgi:large subunit ribosomal protein L22